MSLAQQFTKQQARLQASLASLATRPKAASPSASRKAPAPPPGSQSLVPLARRFSYTHDTEKLQQIATIQKSPVGAQIKRVLDLLFETRQSLLPAEINDLCFVDVNNSKDVFESLKSNPKVSFDGQRFAFRVFTEPNLHDVIVRCMNRSASFSVATRKKVLSKQDLKNKEELLALVSKFPHGVPMGDLKDSYLGIQADVQDLEATGKVWVLKNNDSQEDIVYPNDPKFAIKVCICFIIMWACIFPFSEHVDEDFKQLIRGIDTPREFMDVERELEIAGMKSATNSARKEAMAGVPRPQIPKPKNKRRESKRTKYTNAHLPELFKSVKES